MTSTQISRGLETHKNGFMQAEPYGLSASNSIQGNQLQYNFRPRSGKMPQTDLLSDLCDHIYGSDEDKNDLAEEHVTADRSLGTKGKRKAGRPIIYEANLNSPLLSDAERKQYKRRIDNRESARRIRNKRASYLSELSEKIARLEARGAHLQSFNNEALIKQADLEDQLALAEQRFNDAKDESSRLVGEVMHLRKHLEVASDRIPRSPNHQAAFGDMEVEHAFKQGNQAGIEFLSQTDSGSPFLPPCLRLDACSTPADSFDPTFDFVELPGLDLISPDLSPEFPEEEYGFLRSSPAAILSLVPSLSLQFD